MRKVVLWGGDGSWMSEVELVAEVTRTSTLLLDGLRDRSCEWAWSQFDARYRPILHAVARRSGLSDADAADVAQDAIEVFVRKYTAGEYDRARARVRTWLCGIARLLIADLRRKRARRGEVAGGTVAEAAMPDEATMTRDWEIERRSAMLRTALERLRATSRFGASTIEAFEMNAMRGMAAERVAESLGMTTHDVYMAKHRVTERLRGLLAELESEFDDGGA